MVRAVLLLSSSSFAALAFPCMGVGPAPVRFTGQTNIVVWDAARGVEHFVRDARFETTGASLGFVAPSPTRPDIVAADASAFEDLARLGPAPAPTFSGGLSGGFAGGGGVDVVERKAVAGYEAAVLKADDPRALAAWLNANGYPMPPYAARWIVPYVRKGWYLTAFKVAAQRGAGATGPVRMSFRTETPFNPYSVPAENRAEGGLKLYYVSATDEEPKIGGVARWRSASWTRYLRDASARALAEHLKLPLSALPAMSFVRCYDDPAFGRPGFDDVYFVPVPKRLGRAAPSPLAFLSLGLFAFVRVGRRQA